LSVKKLPEVVRILEREGRATPNKIATELGSDRRTIQKILKSASELGIAQCEILKVGGRKYSACSLTPQFQKILQNKEGK